MNGARILLTGSRPGSYAARLREIGAIPIAIPTIEIRTIASPALDAALADLERYDWVAVTSPNGARAVGERMDALGVEPPSRLRWAAVGPATCTALERRGLDVDAIPEAGIGVAIAEAIDELDGARILLPRSTSAADDLPRELRARGARVRSIGAYETIEGPESARGPLLEALDEGIDGAVFTSGSTVRGFARIAGSPARALEDAVVVAIGPVTAEVARDLGLTAVTVAEERTPEGVTAALGRALEATRISAGRSR